MTKSLKNFLCILNGNLNLYWWHISLFRAKNMPFMADFFIANISKSAKLITTTKGKKMKKNKIQYAQPIKVSDIKESWNPERGYAGYDIEVIFKDRTNIPHPYHMDPEHIHLFTDLNGTNRVVYSFPFIGYGVINWGKLAAKHWANKMRKQINPANLEPLYKLKDGKTMEFICGEKNRDCVIATLHFQNFKKFIDDLAENKSPRTFPTQEINCCVGENCQIWKNHVAKLKEKIK